MKSLILTTMIASSALFMAADSLAQSRNLEVDTADGPLVVPLKDSEALRILINGDMEATATSDFVCQQGSSCEDVEVSMNGPDGDLLLTPTTVNQGDRVQINWRSRGAWQCTGTGLSGTSWGSSNPKLPTDSDEIDTSGLSLGQHTVGLECSNGPVSDSLTASLTVEEADESGGGGDGSLPSVCGDITPLDEYPGWSRATDVRPPFGPSEEQTFARMFGAFPGTTNTTNLGIRKKQFMSAAFTTGSLTSASKGRLTRNQAELDGSAASIGPGPLIASWSRCPGDFDPASPALPSPSCVIKASNSFIHIKWGGPGSGEGCELQPNTQYFLNIVYTASNKGVLPPVQGSCQGRSRCGHLYKAN